MADIVRACPDCGGDFYVDSDTNNYTLARMLRAIGDAISNDTDPRWSPVRADAQRLIEQAAVLLSKDTCPQDETLDDTGCEA